MPLLSPHLRKALENFAKGVNAYIATLDAQSLPVEFKILQYKPRQWNAKDTITIGKILTDALSNTWQSDLLRASLQKNLSPEKYSDITRLDTPYDVILVGKDTTKNIVSIKNPIDISEENLRFAASMDKIREDSLNRVGLFAKELAASNNWVISGKKTADGKPLLSNDPHLQATAPGIWYMAHLSAPESRSPE